MAGDPNSVLGAWDCPRLAHQSLSFVSELAHRRGLTSRIRRLTRVFSLSPLLFSFVPSMDGDLMSLLGEVEFAAENPHYPASLSVKQRRLIAVVDRTLKYFDASLKASSRHARLQEFVGRFRRLPLLVCRGSVEEIVADSSLSREILSKILSEDEDLDGQRMSADDVSDEEIAVVVFLVLSVLCRVMLNVDGLESQMETLVEQYADASRELRDKGNKQCYMVEGVDDDDAEGAVGDLQRAADLYTAAVTASPFDVHAYQNRATVYFKKGEYDLAFTDALRVHVLDPREKRANYLMAECLYQMGEINAARTLNRQSIKPESIPSPPEMVTDGEGSDAALFRQYDRWRAFERTAKSKLERILNTASYDYVGRRDPLATIEAYGRVDDMIEEYGCAALDLLDIDLAVLAYCRSLAYVASGIPYYIQCAIEKMERILENPALQFPLAFLVLAKAFKKLNVPMTARDWAKRGLETVRRGVVMTGGSHHWPGTRVVIEESRRDKMEEAFLAIMAHCDRRLMNQSGGNTAGFDAFPRV